MPSNHTPDSSEEVKNDDDDDGDKNLSTGNFVIVKFADKTKFYKYIRLVEKLQGDDLG